MPVLVSASRCLFTAGVRHDAFCTVRKSSVEGPRERGGGQVPRDRRGSGPPTSMEPWVSNTCLLIQHVSTRSGNTRRNACCLAELESPNVCPLVLLAPLRYCITAYGPFICRLSKNLPVTRKRSWPMSGTLVSVGGKSVDPSFQAVRRRWAKFHLVMCLGPRETF